MRLAHLIKLACILGLLSGMLAACGGGEPAIVATPAPSRSPAPSVTPLATRTPIPSPTPPLPPAIKRIGDVKKAVIRVESEGNFAEIPEGFRKNILGSGSGFLIDPSGLAITSQRAIAGADEVQVYFPDNPETAFPAKVLGFDACSDLALIDLDGETFEYLGWDERALEVDQAVDTAGFEGEGWAFQLVGGKIIDGESTESNAWSGGDKVILYNSRPDGGQEGGPVISERGEALGVYLGKQAELGQAIALPASQASEISLKIQEGASAQFGANPVVVWNEDETISGVWIAAVVPGSMAEQAGLRGGDFVTHLGGEPAAGDGSIRGYCQAIQEAINGAVAPVRAIRWATGELLEGELNGAPISAAGQVDVNNLLPAEFNTTAEEVVNRDAALPGEEYLVYEFNRPSKNWNEFVISGDPEGFTKTLEDGKLRFDIRTEFTYIYEIYKKMDVADAHLELKAQNLGANNNNISLVCRYSDLGWYEFNVSNNGNYFIYRYDPSLVNPYVKLWDGGSFQINIGQESNDYGAICDDNMLRLMINDKVIRTVYDDTLISGKFGYSVSSWRPAPAIVEIDEFRASVPR